MCETICWMRCVKKNNIKFYLHFSIQGILSKDDEGGRCWCFNGRMFLLSFYFYFNDWLVDVLPTKTKLNFFSLFIEVRSFFLIVCRSYF